MSKNSGTFGKKIGGDILENKKTILYHLALKGGEETHINALKTLLGGDHPIDGVEKINKVKSLFEVTAAVSATQDLIAYHADLANLALEKLSMGEDQKNRIRELKSWLMQRTY